MPTRTGTAILWQPVYWSREPRSSRWRISWGTAGGGPEALREVVEGPSGQYRPPHDGPLSHDRRYKPSHTPVTRKNGGCKLMTPKEIFWCGEGDLFSPSTLKTSKLYIIQRAQNTRSSRNTNLSHTASHTGLPARPIELKFGFWRYLSRSRG